MNMTPDTEDNQDYTREGMFQTVAELRSELRRLQQISDSPPPQEDFQSTTSDLLLEAQRVQEEVNELVSRYDRIAAPVVRSPRKNQQKRMLMMMMMMMWESI